MANGDVHTTYRRDTDEWANKREGGDRASGLYDTKAEAQAAGRDLARDSGAEHYIHNRDGQIGERNTYPRSRDPRRSKG
jgi:Uncharacterized protein conserved in bacteria (DUF2188)